jgi:hypothetical protein
VLDFDCPTCRQRQLLWPGRIQQFINDEDGITVIVRCWCGELGAIRTGSRQHQNRQGRPPVQLLS